MTGTGFLKLFALSLLGTFMLDFFSALKKKIFKVLGQFLPLCFDRICSCECALIEFTAGLKYPLS